MNTQKEQQQQQFQGGGLSLIYVLLLKALLAFKVGCNAELSKMCGCAH
jgi:hypothetical protein